MITFKCTHHYHLSTLLEETERAAVCLLHNQSFFNEGNNKWFLEINAFIKLRVSQLSIHLSGLNCTDIYLVFTKYCISMH